MCHYLLAQALTKPSEIQEHCRASAELIIERAETLVGREEMREVFLNSELVKMIFASVGIQSANLREAKKLLQG
jgi:hypothetical protein